MAGSDELRILERIGRAPLETCRRGTRDWIARSRCLEAAERIWTWKLIPERQIDGRHDDRDILRGLPSLVASDVASTRINISVARADDMRRAFPIVGLIKRQLTLKHGNKDRAGVGVPSSRTTGDVVMRADHNINVTLCLRVEIHKRVRLRFHFEWFVSPTPDQGGSDTDGWGGFRHHHPHRKDEQTRERETLQFRHDILRAPVKTARCI